MAIDDNTIYGLYGSQIKDLPGKITSGIDARLKTNAGAPTTATVGTVGQLLEDTTNGKLYICTTVTPGTDPDPTTYTWIEVGTGGGGGVTILSANDYNYPVDNPTGIAVYALEDGLYYAPFGVNYSYVSGNNVAYTSVRSAFLIVRKSSDTQGLVIRFSPEGFWGNTGDSSGATKLLGTAYQIAFNSSTLAPTSVYNKAGFVTTLDVVNDLNTTATVLPLSANQGKVLNEKIEGRIITNAGAPTTSTTGTVGQLYEDTTNGKLYICTAASGGTYTWEEVGKTYSDFTGATSSVAGAHGLVPAPTTSDVDKYLKGDGTWGTVATPDVFTTNEWNALWA